jgi:hypothetical protein
MPCDIERERIRWGKGMSERIAANPQESIAIWLALRTVINPRTAIWLIDLHAQYLVDFDGFATGPQLLEENELLTMVTDSYPDGSVEVESEDGMFLLLGLNWATSNETEVSAQANGVELDSRQKNGSRKRERPQEAGNNESLQQLTANDTDNTKARKDSMFDPANIDADGKYRAWLREVLVEDDVGSVGRS